MHTGSKNCYKPYVPSDIAMRGGIDQNSIHCSQYIRDHIRKVHPPGLHIDTSLLQETLDPSYNQPPPRVLTTSKSSPQRSHENIPSTEQNEVDGFISPLELPPRLTEFDNVDGGKTDCKSAVLWTPAPTLDIGELQRRLESIARIQRLSETGLLQKFLNPFLSTHF